jgi:hypothetical protein
MVFLGTILSAAAVQANVGTDAASFKKQFHNTSSQAYVHLALDIFKRHGVILLINGDVIV